MFAMKIILLAINQCSEKGQWRQQRAAARGEASRDQGGKKVRGTLTRAEPRPVKEESLLFQHETPLSPISHSRSLECLDLQSSSPPLAELPQGPCAEASPDT